MKLFPALVTLYLTDWISSTIKQIKSSLGQCRHNLTTSLAPDAPDQIRKHWGRPRSTEIVQLRIICYFQQSKNKINFSLLYCTPFSQSNDSTENLLLRKTANVNFYFIIKSSVLSRHYLWSPFVVRPLCSLSYGIFKFYCVAIFIIIQTRNVTETEQKQTRHSLRTKHSTGAHRATLKYYGNCFEIE